MRSPIDQQTQRRQSGTRCVRRRGGGCAPAEALPSPPGCTWRCIAVSPSRLHDGTVMTGPRAWAAPTAGAPPEPFGYGPGPLGAEDVDITVEHCGVCHSDLAMLDNEWGFTQYPF